MRMRGTISSSGATRIPTNSGLPSNRPVGNAVTLPSSTENDPRCTETAGWVSDHREVPATGSS
jgi:hypothetical protein